MALLEINEEEFLVVSRGTEEPEPRTWKQCLEDLGYLESESDIEQWDDILELFGIERGDLDSQVPSEKLCELFVSESPSGAVYDVLSKFESDPRVCGVVEFHECPGMGGSFYGAKLVGTRMEFRHLLEALGLHHELHLSVEAEETVKKVVTKAARDVLRSIEPDAHDSNLDLINSLPVVEEYIQRGEPALNRFTGRIYHSALSEIPKGSELYEDLKSELRQKLSIRSKEHKADFD